MNLSSPPSPPHQVLYLSHLAEGLDWRVFAAVSQVARERNARLGISGALLFDGQRFCQWLQGPVRPVQDLMRSILADDRHCRIVVLTDGEAGTAPRTQGRWINGYCEAHALDALDSEAAPRAGAAVRALQQVLAEADLQP